MAEPIRIQEKPKIDCISITEVYPLKVHELMDLLKFYDHNDEIQIEIHETHSDEYIDTTADISVVEEDVYAPTLKIDIETGKLKEFLIGTMEKDINLRF